MGDVYSVFSYWLIGVIPYLLSWFCVVLLLFHRIPPREPIMKWMKKRKIISTALFVLCLAISILSNRSFYRWIGCNDIRTLPAGEYCYYVKVNRVLDDRVYTLPAKIEVTNTSVYTDNFGDKHPEHIADFYLRNVYFDNGGYLTIDDEGFEFGKPFEFMDQDYEYWECTVTEQRCTPAPFVESKNTKDADTVRITFCVLILVLTYISLQVSIREQKYPRFTVYFSYWGKRYHSTESCPELKSTDTVCHSTYEKSPYEIRKRYPCHRCCCYRDGKVYPIDPETTT